jgi:hypothetical protein
MALIERNINPRQSRNTPRPFVNLKYGLLLAGAGLGLLLAFIIDINHSDRVYASGIRVARDYSPVYFALIGLCGGLGLILSYRIEKKEWNQLREADSHGTAAVHVRPYDEVIS